MISSFPDQAGFSTTPTGALGVSAGCCCSVFASDSKREDASELLPPLKRKSAARSTLPAKVKRSDLQFKVEGSHLAGEGKRGRRSGEKKRSMDSTLQPKGKRSNRREKTQANRFYQNSHKEGEKHTPGRAKIDGSHLVAKGKESTHCQELPSTIDTSLSLS